LIGRRVLDREGRSVGRLEEMRATKEGDYYVVSDFYIGPSAFIERFAARHFGLRWPGHGRGYRAWWDQLDLSDPERPRLACDRSELKKV